MPGTTNRHVKSRECAYCSDEPLTLRVRIGGKLTLACADCALAAGLYANQIVKASGISSHTAAALASDGINDALELGADPDSILDDLRFAVEDRIQALQEKLDEENRVTGPLAKRMAKRVMELERLVEKLERL